MESAKFLSRALDFFCEPTPGAWITCKIRDDYCLSLFPAPGPCSTSPVGSIPICGDALMPHPNGSQCFVGSPGLAPAHLSPVW